MLLSWPWIAVVSLLILPVGGRLVSLSPLKGVGVLRVGGVGGSTEMPAAYLARETGVEIFDDNKGNITLFDVVPLLMEKEATTSWVDRDGGLYDNIPYPVLFPSNPLAKKALWESVKEAQQKCPASAFLASLRERNLFVCGLLVEVASQLTPTSLTLGAAVLLARTEAQDCLLSEEDALEINNTSIIVACRRDELLQIAECLPNLRIKMASSLFRKVSLDAVLRENKLIASTREESNIPTGRENVPPAWEILDAERFLSMGIYEKRAVLRASGGATKVPRPREGEEALDRALESFMDASVRELVVRQRLHRHSSSDPSGTSPTSSVRAALLHDIAKAINDGDMSKAHILGNDFARATRLLADPTQDSGSYDKYLDGDEWYERNRRRSMGRK